MNDRAGSRRPRTGFRARRPVMLTAAISAALVVMAGLMAATAASAGSPQGSAHQGARFASDGSRLVLTEHGSPAAPGYRVVVQAHPFSVTTTRNGSVVLATTSAADTAAAPVQFTVAGNSYHATSVKSSSWSGSALTLNLATTDPGHDVTYTITPSAGQYTYHWSVAG